MYIFPNINSYSTPYVSQLGDKLWQNTSHPQAISFKNHSIKHMTTARDGISSFIKYITEINLKIISKKCKKNYF